MRGQRRRSPPRPPLRRRARLARSRFPQTGPLAPKLLAKVTRPELPGAFEKGPDGFSAIAFRVYGTTLDPKTDLLARLDKAAAMSVAKDQLNKLFKKKPF